MSLTGSDVTRAEDISLVSFVVLLLKQWKVMLGCVALLFFLVLLIIFFKPVKYDFTTMYSVASYETTEGVKKGLETPEEVIAKIDNIFLEQERRALLSGSEIDGLPFEISITNPNNTFLLKISSTATSQYDSLIKDFHEGLVEAIRDDQSNLVESLKENLQYQYDAYSEVLATARESASEGARELEANYFERSFQLERRMSSINEGVSSQLAVRSLEPVGVSNFFILAFGIVLSLLFAPLAAMLSIFLKRVIVTYQSSE